MTRSVKASVPHSCGCGRHSPCHPAAPARGGAPYPSRVTPAPPARITAPAYAERLRLSWWMWLPALIVDAIVGFEILLGFARLPAWAPFAVVVPVTVVTLVWLGRVRVAVAGEE